MELTSHFNVRLSRSSVVSSVFTEKENTFLTANRDGTITVVTFQPKFRQSSKKITHSEITAMAYEINDTYSKSKSISKYDQCLHRVILGTVNGDLIVLSKNLEIITVLHRKHFDRIVKIQFINNNKYFITASYDCSLKIFNSETYEYVSSFYEHQSWINDFSIAPNEKTFITASADQKLRLFDIKKKRCIAIIGPFPFVPTTVLFHPHGKHYFIGFTNGVVACYKLKGAKKVLSVQLHQSSVSDISLHMSGLFLASVSVDSTISILEVEKVNVMFSMLVKQKGLNSVTFSKDGWQLMTTSVSGRLTIWDFPFNSLVIKSSSGNSSSANSNENDQSNDENSFPEVSPLPNNSNTLPVNFQNQNIMQQQQQIQFNIPNIGQFSYSQNASNAVYINGMNMQQDQNNSNPYEFSDSNSFASVQAQQINSSSQIKVNDNSYSSNPDGVVRTDIIIEEEEEENETSSQGELFSSEEELFSSPKAKVNDEEKRSVKSFNEEESERFSSSKFKEEEEKHSIKSYKEEEEKFSSSRFKEEEDKRSTKSFKEEEEKHSIKSFKEEEERFSSRKYKEEEDKHSIKSSKEEEEKHSIKSFKEEEERFSIRKYKEEEDKHSNKSFKEEEERFSSRKYKEEEDKHSTKSFKEEEERFSSNKFKEEEDKHSTKSYKEEEEDKHSNKIYNEEEESSNTKEEANSSKKVLTHNSFNEEEDKKNSVKHVHDFKDEEDGFNKLNQNLQKHHSSIASNGEEEEESNEQSHLIQSTIVIQEEEEEDESDNIQYIDSNKFSNNYENQNENNNNEEEESSNIDLLKSSSSSILDENQQKISKNDSENLNLSANDTLNEIVIEIKPSNTEESFSESIHDLQQTTTSTSANHDNSIQINQTEFLTNSDSQTKKSIKSQVNKHSEVEDFNATFTVNSSGINTESPVYDFNNYSDKENDLNDVENNINNRDASDENEHYSYIPRLSSSQPVVSNKKATNQTFHYDSNKLTINSNMKNTDLIILQNKSSDNGDKSNTGISNESVNGNLSETNDE